MLAWTLKTKPATLGSVGSRARGSAGCGRGGGAQAASASSSSRMPGAVGVEVERRVAGAHQLDFLRQPRIVDGVVLDHLADAVAILRIEHQHAVVDEIVGALEGRARAGRPGHGRHVERQRRGDLVEELDRVLGLAVHLVDEGDDRHVAQAADLEQLAGARLDALGGVDHHDRGVDGGQRAVGVLGEVLVAGRVEQVEHRAAVLEVHHRGGDRDAALLLDLHPVRAGAPGLAAGLHRPRDVDGAAEQQQLLGQGRLAGVRVGDDRERAPETGGVAGQAGVGSGDYGGIGHFRASRGERGGNRATPERQPRPPSGRTGRRRLAAFRTRTPHTSDPVVPQSGRKNSQRPVPYLDQDLGAQRSSRRCVSPPEGHVKLDVRTESAVMDRIALENHLRDACARMC
jgi:hypothetical protein